MSMRLSELALNQIVNLSLLQKRRFSKELIRFLLRYCGLVVTHSLRRAHEAYPRLRVVFS